MTNISLDRIATVLGMTESRQADSHEFASVVQINEDGSYGVRFNGATDVTRAVKCCDARVGDRVQCVISNGQVTAIGRVGGTEGSVVLYSDDSGTTGTVTLASSASNFDYMRIYYKKSGDTQAVSSVDIYQPDGKTVSLILMNPFDDSNVQAVGKAVTISGTSITNYRREAYANTNSGGVWVTTTSPTIAITRVEGWNEQERRSSSSSGGGGSATSYNDLANKPTITEPVYGTSEYATVTIQGNKTFDELGMHPFSEAEIESLLTAADV